MFKTNKSWFSVSQRVQKTERIYSRTTPQEQSNMVFTKSAVGVWCAFL